ncbi:MAG: alanine racemase, partial [Candidatus Paceibacterota bacterium]
MKDLDRKGLRTWIEIDTKTLENNYKVLRASLPSGCKLMSVSKSNAYGHSLVDFSKEVEKLGADWIGVDSVVEAITLREESVKIPMLVLGYTLPEMLEKASDLNISLSVSTFETLNAIEQSNFSKKLKIHIKVDTGM